MKNLGNGRELGSTAAPAGASLHACGVPGAAQYLDLLKKCLTGYLYPESSSFPLRPPSHIGFSPRAAAKWALVRLADRFGYGIQKVVRFDPWLRESGSDWPMIALTMVGLKRLDNLQWCIEDVLRNNVPGDLIETGVWRGGCTILMRAVLAAHGDTSRCVWAADSFEGMPRPSAEKDKESLIDLSDNEYLSASLEDVRANFARFGLLGDQVHFLKGWFQDTLVDAPIERLSILRLDCDLYGSTMLALNALYRRVQPGGYVIVDDYGSWRTSKAAVDEYRREHRITEPLRDIDGQGYYWQVN